jgi:transposase
MEAARKLRDSSICEAAKTMSVRKISAAIGLGKSTINQVVRAGG